MVINNQFPLKNTGSSNTIGQLETPRHRWYYYKEGFSHKLVEYAIEQFGIKKNDVVIDPFNGSGTVTLAGSKNQVSTLGIEVNPFAVFIAKTKLANPSISDINRELSKVNRSMELCTHVSPLTNFSTFTKQRHLTKWLFDKNVLNSYHSGFEATKDIKKTDTRNVIRLALLNSIIDNCNAARDGKCFRYKKDWENLRYSTSTLFDSFERNINIIKQDLIQDPIKEHSSKIIQQDSRIFLSRKIDTKFKLCITSPPYLNSFDYTDVYRPELFLGGFIKDAKSLLNLRGKTLRSHASAKRSELKNINLGPLYENTISQLELSKSRWQNKIPVMIQAYFEDMEHVLRNLKNNASKGAEAWFVVSNSAYNGLEIPVDLILADISCRVGWKLQEIGVLRNIPKRGSKYSPGITHLRESVIIVKKL